MARLGISAGTYLRRWWVDRVDWWTWLVGNGKQGIVDRKRYLEKANDAAMRWTGKLFTSPRRAQE